MSRRQLDLPDGAAAETDSAAPLLSLYADTPEAYARYVVERREATNPTTRENKLALGAKVFEKKGCNACHTIDGTPRVGVSMAGLWGSTVELVDGSMHDVDAKFIERSLVDPQTYRRKGFSPAMPSYEGQLRPGEVVALVMYIEQLADVKARGSIDPN